MRAHDLPATDKHDDEVGCTFLQSPAVVSLLLNEDCVADLTLLLAVAVYRNQSPDAKQTLKTLVFAKKQSTATNVYLPMHPYIV